MVGPSPPAECVLFCIYNLDFGCMDVLEVSANIFLLLADALTEGN